MVPLILTRFDRFNCKLAMEITAMGGGVDRTPQSDGGQSRGKVLFRCTNINNGLAVHLFTIPGPVPNGVSIIPESGVMYNKEIMVLYSQAYYISLPSLLHKLAKLIT